jgi:hypothetical protein
MTDMNSHTEKLKELKQQVDTTREIVEQCQSALGAWVDRLEEATRILKHETVKYSIHLEASKKVG